MKRKLQLVIFTILCFFAFFVKTYSAIELNLYSEHALLYNLDESSILYEKKAKEPVSIASLTKIMTAIITIENVTDLEEKIILTHDDFKGLIEKNASVAGFYQNESVSIKDLLYGLMLPSGADAAQALTRIIAKNKESFVKLMNEKAVSLGLSNTVFKNEVGLDEEGQYSTAYDVANLLRYALKNETFKEIFESKEYQTSNGLHRFTSSLQKFMTKNHMPLDYIKGGKTGTTDQAGLALITTANYNDTNYLLVTIKAPNDWVTPTHLLDHKNIYEYFMSHYKKEVLYQKGSSIISLNTQNATPSVVNFYIEEEIEKYLPINYQKEDIKIEYQGIKTIKPSTKKGTKLGVASIIYQKEVLKTIDIILTESISFSFTKYLKNNREVIILGTVILFLLLFLIIKKIKKQ